MPETPEGTTARGEASGQASVHGGGGGSWFPCPYCGTRQEHGSARCESCGGQFEPLSRQATQNQMGPWFVREAEAAFMPGRSYLTIRRMAQRGRITPETVLRGPTTRQFWMAASEVPGVANLLGRCHLCKRAVKPESFSCDFCGTVFPTPEDRQGLGLGPVRLLPGQAVPELVARSAAVGAVEVAGSTAFSRLSAGASGGLTSGSARPARPEPMAPADGAATASAGEGSPELRRALRLANRRVAALRNLVIAMAVLSVVAMVILAGMVLSGLGTGGSAPGPQDALGSSE